MAALVFALSGIGLQGSAPARTSDRLSVTAGAVSSGADVSGWLVAPIRDTQAAASAPGVHRCIQNRAGLEYFRTTYERYRSNLNPRFVGNFRPARTLSCRYVHYLAGVMRERAKSARADYERWHRGRLNRYRRLYEKWRCIHEHEGAWNSETGNGYHGGLQFDDGFQRTYGPEFMERWGNASAWPVWAQLEAAERAFHGFAGFKGRGYSPWGTRGMCGL